MSKKKPRNDPQRATTGDRHKPSKMFRVPTALADLLEELAEEEVGTSSSEQLKTAVREYLIRKGKLPGRGQQ